MSTSLSTTAAHYRFGTPIRAPELCLAPPLVGRSHQPVSGTCHSRDQSTLPFIICDCSTSKGTKASAYCLSTNRIAQILIRHCQPRHRRAECGESRTSGSEGGRRKSAPLTRGNSPAAYLTRPGLPVGPRCRRWGCRRRHRAARLRGVRGSRLLVMWWAMRGQFSGSSLSPPGWISGHFTGEVLGGARAGCHLAVPGWGLPEHRCFRVPHPVAGVLSRGCSWRWLAPGR